VGRGEYVLSDDPWAFEQFGTMEYRGRSFLVVDNVPKRRGPPPSAHNRVPERYPDEVRAKIK
jgi:hypothetical protein